MPSDVVKAVIRNLQRKARLEAGARDVGLLELAQAVIPGYKISKHIEKTAELLEAVERGEVRRAMIEAPPQHGKSTLMSVIFPAYYLGRHPERRVILASYGGELATGFGGQARNITLDGRYRGLFPHLELAEDSRAKNLWHTNAGGFMLSAGVSGPITGWGADLGLLDDIIKTQEEAESATYREQSGRWYRADFYTRLSKGAAIVGTMTRRHEDDLFGRLLRAMEEGTGDRWVRLRLPAIAEGDDWRQEGEALWPEMFPLEALEQRRAVLTPREWSALYQQRPMPLEGATFKWWATYEETETPPRIIVLPIDMAYTEGGDYSAWAAWKSDGHFKDLIGAGRFKGEHPEAIRQIRAYREQLRARFPYTPVKALVRKSVAVDRIAGQYLRTMELNAEPVSLPKGNTKEELAGIISGYFETGEARIPSRRAPWLEPWQAEHLSFPGGLNDDWVETTVVGLWYLARRRPREPQREPTYLYGEV